MDKAGEADSAAVATRVAAAFAREPTVTAVAWGGSWVTGAARDGSDIDLYVYAETAVPLAIRTGIAARFAGDDPETELDNRFWEPGDEWRDAASSLWIDIMYRTPAWIEERLVKVLDRHEASTGYSTCFWHNARTSRALFDRSGWYAQLQRQADRPYPEELRRAVVAANQPLLAGIHSSFRSQIAAAIERGDRIAVNHRVAAFLASLFDVLFALNRVPHPGEKRLMAYAEMLCPARPTDLGERVDVIGAPSGGAHEILTGIDALVTEVNLLLGEAGLLPMKRT